MPHDKVATNMQMTTYFIRHTSKISIDDDTRDYLWRKRKIAIHFPWTKRGHKPKDSTSLNPDDYKGSDRRAIRAMVRLANSGGYVCAQHHPHSECMLGFVKPWSKIQLFRGKWNAKKPGRTAVLKTLQLTKVTLVEPQKNALLLVGRPRMGTINRWPSAGKNVENIVEGRRIKRTLQNLFHNQPEILCSEFLRSKRTGLPRLAHLVLPPGRNMKDIDIFGMADDGKMLLAQVTLYSLAEAQKKLKRLREYCKPKPTHLIMFCACDKSITQDGVLVFPIGPVFKWLTSTKLGKEWLRLSA